MLKRKISHNCMGVDIKARLLLDVFMFSTLLGGIHCEYSTLPEMKISKEKRSANPGELYPVSVPSDNKTVYNENVQVTTGFDKMLHWIFDKEVEKGDRRYSGRSFRFGHRFAGHRKRLQFALLPIMYKMGVMTTLLTGLTVLVLKGLTIGVILLIFAFGNYFTKLHKHSYQSSQPIHVHYHTQEGHGKISSFPSYESGIAPWNRVMVEDEANPSSFLPDQDLESYRRRQIQNLAATLKFKPLI